MPTSFVARTKGPNRGRDRSSNSYCPAYGEYHGATHHRHGSSEQVVWLPARPAGRVHVGGGKGTGSGLWTVRVRKVDNDPLHQSAGNSSAWANCRRRNGTDR